MLIKLMLHYVIVHLKVFFKNLKIFFSIFHIWVYYPYFGMILQKGCDTRGWITINSFKKSGNFMKSRNTNPIPTQCTWNSRGCPWMYLNFKRVSMNAYALINNIRTIMHMYYYTSSHPTKKGKNVNPYKRIWEMQFKISSIRFKAESLFCVVVNIILVKMLW